MARPFAKKNPWLSLWLSAANAWAGMARGLMTAEFRRQQATAARRTGGKPAAARKAKRAR